VSRFGPRPGRKGTIVLDTDVLSIVPQARGETYDRLANRLNAAGAGGAVDDNNWVMAKPLQKKI
jgi:hypothetical protein